MRMGGGKGGNDPATQNHQTKEKKRKEKCKKSPIGRTPSSEQTREKMIPNHGRRRQSMPIAERSVGAIHENRTRQRQRERTLPFRANAREASSFGGSTKHEQPSVIVKEL
mmetsp:Transcript_20810/g.46232  ORF Transcript_20810/g.46232 Transcript_20810/m.46232 type:complete len:110 (-) Transcript_20810:216-545(-)